MSYLVLDPLEAAALTQTFQVEERIQVEAVRPWLYFHNDPSGTFTVSIRYNGNVIGSKSFTMEEIKTLAGWGDNEYHHGFIKFDFGGILNPTVDYQIELSSSGYTYDPNSYIGWVKPHENLINTLTDTVTYADENPFGFQLWGYK